MSLLARHVIVLPHHYRDTFLLTTTTTTTTTTIMVSRKDRRGTGGTCTFRHCHYPPPRTVVLPNPKKNMSKQPCLLNAVRFTRIHATPGTPTLSKRRCLIIFLSGFVAFLFLTLTGFGADAHGQNPTKAAGTSVEVVPWLSSSS